MDFLDSLIWERVVDDQYVTNPTFCISDYFEIVRQPGDGNCFYHSIAELFFDVKTPFSFRKVKEHLRLAADAFYDTEPEAIGTGVTKEEYIQAAMKDNEWGGSLEASMLSKQLQITIILWVVNQTEQVTAAIKFGPGRVSTALNLMHVGRTHFDALRVINQLEDNQLQSRNRLDLIDKISAAEVYVNQSIEDNFQEDEFFDYAREDETSEKPSLSEETRKQTELRQKAMLLNKTVKRGENIPIRVGRVLDCLFSCKIAVNLDGGLLSLRPETRENESTSISLRQLGHKLLTKDKHIKMEYARSKLYVTKDLIDHLDIGGLLRSSFPGMGLERYIQLLHSELVLDLVTVVLAVLLSTFLYGSNNKNKKQFVTNCLLSTKLSGKRVFKALSKLTGQMLYSTPKKAVCIVSQELYGKLMLKVKDNLEGMGPISMLALRNLDFDNMQLQDYLEMLSEMSKIDNSDVEYTHREISDLHILVDRLNKLQKSQDVNELKLWFKEETITKRSMRSISNAYEFLINDYFKKKDIMKFVSTSGKASSTGNIGNVLSYAHNLYLSKESLRMTSEDVTQLLIEIRKLHKLQGDLSIEPVAIICDKLEDQFRRLFKELPEECSRECQTLFNDIRNSPSHAVAWKHALRLKGTAYEGMFAKQYGWSYISEDIKPSLTMIVQTLFPESFEAFLDRTQLHPEFRDLTPDYTLTQKIFFPKNTIPRTENRQLAIDATLEDSVEAVPVVEKRMFPLPEVPIGEANSISRVMGIFKNKKDESIQKKIEHDRQVEEKRQEEEDKAKAAKAQNQTFSKTASGTTDPAAGKPIADEQLNKENEGRESDPEVDLSSCTSASEAQNEIDHSPHDISDTKSTTSISDKNNSNFGSDFQVLRGKEEVNRPAAEVNSEPVTDEFPDYGYYFKRIVMDENGTELSEEAQLEKRQLLFIEVGYQTDVDGKITTDYKKWKDILKLLELLNIKCSFIACADCSSTPSNNWWISEDKVRLLKNSISHLFSKLTQNSPADVTDIVVGSISTQKVRSYLKSGTATKTPISLKDVQETWAKMKEHIINRPTGVVLNKELTGALYQGLVEGAIISKDGTTNLIQMLKDKQERLTDEFERTKVKHEVNENVKTSEKLLLGWLMEDLKGCRCTECLIKIKELSESMTINQDRLEYLSTNCQLKSHCTNCHPKGLECRNTTNVDNRVPSMQRVSHSKNEGFEDTNETLTELDRLVRLTLPGKTEKERRVKRNVEGLIRYMMQQSGIDCIKLPSGQIIAHRCNRKFKHSSDADEKCNERFERLSKELSELKLKPYSDHVKKTIASSLKRTEKQEGSKCAVPRQWLETLIRDLKVPTKDEEILLNIRTSMQSKTSFLRNNDKLIIRSNKEIADYLEAKRKSLLSEKTTDKVFSSDCLLFKEVVAEALKRYHSTPYEGVPEVIVKLINFLCTFGWFQEVVLYSKICETFLRCCTEFSRSGIKLVKVRHCDINLSIKLPSNKKENMLCCIYDKNMSLLKGPFFLNRRQAILGSAYPYILMTLYTQVLQQHRCLEALNDINDRTIGNINNCTNNLLNIAKTELTLTNSGLFEKAYECRTEQCKLGGTFLNRSSRDHFISTVSGLNLVYGALIKDNLLANSQPQNKQLQMLRFGMLCGLSRLSSALELGKKFSTSCRRIEDNIMRLYLQSTVYSANRDVVQNVQNWKIKDLCPDITIPCFSVYGLFVNSDRQLIFDIYNVHIYNKEMDNFDEGCITVLEETAERHMLWELDLLRSLEGDTKDTRAARLLLGCPNIRKAVDRDGNRLLKKGTMDDVKDETGSDSSSISGRRSYASSGTRVRSMFGKYNSTQKPFELKPGLEVVNDPLHDYKQAVQDSFCYSEYTPNVDSVLKDCIHIIRTNPSHTMGSYELIQAVTENARRKYPPENIEKARKDPKNWVSISEVTETTSIVSQPRTHFMLKDCYKVLLGTENKKIVKMLRGKLKKLGAMRTDIEIGKRDCLDLLTTVDGLSEEQCKNIVNGIFEPSKLAFYHWKDLLKKELNEVLLTDDGNYIYCWLKTLSSMIKHSLKKDLRFMTGKNSFDIKPDLFSEDEYYALKVMKSELLGEQTDGIQGKTHLLLSSWKKCTFKPKEGQSILSTGLNGLAALHDELYDIRLQHLELTRIKKENPTVSFTKEEILVKRLEKSFLNKFKKEIMEAINLIFYCCLAAPWCLHYKSLEAYLVRHPEILETESIKENDIPLLDLTVTSLIRNLVNDSKEDLLFNDSSDIKVSFAVKYLITLFTANGEPFSLSLNDGGLNEDLQLTTDEKLLHQTKKVFAKLGLSGNNYDFIWTLQMIANSNFNVCKRLTGRTTGERLPRSVRSKVIYEMVKLVGETGMAILQQLAFSQALNYDHRFYAVLAPKAQLGGSRDLLVQETGTKVIHATTEMFSRNLLKTTSDDGLTNPHLKETILNVGLDMLSTARALDGKQVSEDSKLVNFFKAVCISGDNTKWGPIHCCSFFSGMMQQLLKDVQDWSSFYKLTFIKNLCRQIEIPAPSIKKVLNVLRFKLSNKGGVEKLSEEAIRSELINNLSEWEGNDTVKFLITTYISKGIMAMNSYNHMGQGIHHATSSLLTSMMAETFEELAVDYIKKHFPGLTVNVDHAGSSDDYAKCIVVSGLVSRDIYTRYDEVFWRHMCRLKNFLAAVQRCCQMKDSAKTLVGDCFLEFYSEFMMGNRVTPAVIKFIFTGLINSSVTSPQSLVQACHVSSQQGMYNSVPLVTNTAFTILRQQIFYNHVEDFIRRYGLITLGAVSSFGRLFLPKFSGLVSSSVALEDSETISKAAAEINSNDIFFNTSSLSNLDKIEQSPDSSGLDDDSAVSITTVESSDSKGSSSSFTFDLNRPLSETEVKFLKLLRELTSTTACELLQEKINILYSDSREGPLDRHNILQNCRLSESCDWLIDGKKRGLLELSRRVACLLNVLIAGYYRSFGSEGTEKQVKASWSRDDNRVIEDPMIQLIPEKLRRELERLGLSRMEVDELMPAVGPDESLSQLVAKKLISLNVSTEEYSAEVSRLKQTLTARNVLHGLAGGIKELSLPIYTIFMKSYFFKDNVFLDLEDRWSSRHSANYRDSSGKMLTGKVVTKFTHWLDTFLSCVVSANRSQEIKECSLFNPNLRCVNIMVKEDGVKELSYIRSHLSVLSVEFENLNLQFSDVNRQKLKIVESRPPECELEANKAIIVKSKLFSAVEHVRLSNNPAVVMGYLLEESSISEIKPTKVDFSNLLKDRFKLMQFFPSVFTLLRALQCESKELERMGEPVDMHQVSKYANHLTLLCRMIQQSKPSLTVFYMLKGSQMNTEPTVSELVSYGIKEGRFLKLPEIGLDASTYSVRYWKILHCISAIGEMPLSSKDKTSLLISFLNWKVTSDCVDDCCPLEKHDKAIISEFSGQVLINTLASELSSVRKDQEREGLTDLIDYINSPNELLKKKPYLGTTCRFQCWGEGAKSGKFTYSSRTGEAIGIFVAGKLHIHLTSDSPGLLCEVERQVLSWLGKRRTDVLTKEQHQFFMDFLPNLSEVVQKNRDGTVLGVAMDNANVRMLKYMPPKKNTPVVKIKKQILTVKKQTTLVVESEPRIVWGHGQLSIVYDECETETTYHENLIKIKKLVDLASGTSDKLPAAIFSDTRVTLAKVRFKTELLLNSLCLLHCFLKHTSQDAIQEVESKCNVLERYLRSGGIQFKPMSESLDKKLTKAHLQCQSDREIDKEVSFCEDLTRIFSQENVPLSSWSEVQSYIEEVGFGNILVQVEKNPTRSDLIWRFSIDSVGGSFGPIRDIRTLVTYMSTETIPKFLLPFLLFENQLKSLMTSCIELRDALNGSGINDKEIAVVALFTCFYYQLDSVKRPGPICSISSFCNLIGDDLLLLDSRLQARILPEQENVKLNFRLNLTTDSTLSKKDKAVQAKKIVNRYLKLIFSEEDMDLKKLKNEATNVKLLSDRECEFLEFCLHSDLSYALNYRVLLEQLIDLEDKAKKTACVLIEEFILMLAGRLTISSAVDMDSMKPTEDEALCLEDLLDSDDENSQRKTDDEEQVALQTGKLNFNWDSD
ncbi:RNA-dependent RNA polymerase [Kupe virus]|uniref:RNA-directed RNA polymerase L n=1 Tax=Kupe virus TaxID=498356 RepID=B8PWH5_9VIRU|nr:RNA-dependent RNA polymerase [Kupe virus]ABY82502.1 RNA-dependent RNA polymerase [Kupe virus]